jgi:energy-coupling factor transport system permease protein
VSPGPAAALLAGAATAALLAQRLGSVAVIAAVLLASCLRAPVSRRRAYLAGILVVSLTTLVFWPLVQATGSHPLWTGPIVPVLGQLDVTREELGSGLVQAVRLAAVGLAFAAYALLLDHDRLVRGAASTRRFVLAVALATRLVPTLERDARGFVESLRGRGLAVRGVGAHARLLSPLLAGSLERGLNLAEAMEARGYGSPGRTQAPRPGWNILDRLALVAAGSLPVIGALWL